MKLFCNNVCRIKLLFVALHHQTKQTNMKTNLTTTKLILGVLVGLYLTVTVIIGIGNL